eukprot:557728-Pyramimonas_sp.AAC.1
MHRPPSPPSQVSVLISSFLGSLCALLVVLRDSPFVTPGIAGFVLSYSVVIVLRAPAVMLTTANMER